MHKNVRRALLALLVVVVLIGGLVACQEKTTPQGAASPYSTFNYLLVRVNAIINKDLDVDGTTNLDDVDIDLSSEFEIDGALVDIGGGTGGTADGDNDLLVAGDLEVDDTLDVDGDIDLNGDGFDVDITAGASIDTDGATNLSASTGDITVEAETGSLILKGDEAAADAVKIDANEAVTSGLDIDVGSVSGVTIDGGLVDIGGGSYATANGDNDLGVAGDLEVDGATDLDGSLSVAGALTFAAGAVEYADLAELARVTYATQAITYTAGAGGTATLATITDGEIWIVWGVYVQTTTNWTVTAGDDETLTIGDGNDADGLIAAAHTQLLTAFTEATGFPAGWYGLEDGSDGVYTQNEGGFIYAPSGADETIDIAWGATGDDLTGGAATIWLIYTRIQ